MTGKSLHGKLLYRWVGRDTENPNRPKASLKLPDLKLGRLTARQRADYFQRICEALDPEKGLLATVLNDYLVTGCTPSATIKLTLPCLCFTELSLSTAELHCRKYGRLGFGFTKKAVLDLSGRPVAYIGGGSQDPNVKKLLQIRRVLEQANNPEKGLRAFEYLCHFYKRMRFPVAQASPDREKKLPLHFPPKPKTILSPEDKMHFPGLRPFPFLEEQEWRVALSTPGNFHAHQTIKMGRWVPVVPGDQLQVLVVPDNVLYQQVLADEKLRNVIAPRGAVCVQVISWEIIGRL